MNMIRAFLSHSHHDNDFCDRLVAFVKNQLADADIFYDKKYLRPSDEWLDILQRQLIDRNIFIVVLSPYAIASKWVKQETNFALHEANHAPNSLRRIIPIIHEPCDIKQLSSFLLNYQFIDCFNQDELKGFTELIEVLRNLAIQGEPDKVIEPEVVLVPQGPFLMGRLVDFDNQSMFDIEVPKYYIGRYPVTVEEYSCYARNTQHTPQHWNKQLSYSDHPVVYISWYDAVAYTSWLSAVTSKNYRLPTEADWEKAACWDENRSLIYPWGNIFDSHRCNTRESNIFGTSPVTEYLLGASPCGAQDMAGNVWEWCSSLYKKYPYRKDDGREDLAVQGRRVQRGGSWRLGADYARCACRSNFNPDLGGDTEGFRIVLDISS